MEALKLSCGPAPGGKERLNRCSVHAPSNIIMRLLKRGIVLLIALLTSCGLVYWLFVKKSAHVPKVEQVKATAGEIMSLGELYRGPEVNDAETDLYFTRSTAGGRAIFRVDLDAGTLERFPHTNEVLRIFGISPDNRHFIFRDLVRTRERLVIYDFKRQLFEPVKENRGIGSEVVWLSSNKFAFVYKANNQLPICSVTISNGEQIAKCFSNRLAVVGLLAMSENKLGYVQRRNIWSMDLTSGTPTQLSRLLKGAFTTDRPHRKLLPSDFMWLTYSRDNGEFLFCSSDESNWRHLFRFDPAVGDGNEVRQLTYDEDHSYNGKWVQRSKGIAYIGNWTNHFHLAVRTEESVANTNLFLGGHVYGFTVSANGERLYAAASEGIEPPGVWQYDISRRILRCVIPGINTPFVASAVLPREEHWIESFDDLKVPFLLIKPKDLDRRRKYPVIIATPPDGNQFYQAWENYSQFFGNIGVFHIAVNHRGIDGYGNRYRAITPQQAYRDIMAVRTYILKAYPSIDASRIFLMGYSGGSAVVKRLAQEHSKLWEGVIIISGSPAHLQVTEKNVPRCFLFMGLRDSPALLQEAKEFEQWGKEHAPANRVLYGPRTGHVITDTNVDKALALALAEFIFNRSYQE